VKDCEIVNEKDQKEKKSKSIPLLNGENSSENCFSKPKSHIKREEDYFHQNMAFG